MTTAHRPTWAPVKGKEKRGIRGVVASQMVSSLDLPAHTTLKLRQPGQSTQDEIQQKNLREALYRKELENKRKAGEIDFDVDDDAGLSDDEAKHKETEVQTKKAKTARTPKNLDADDSDSSDDESSDEDNDSNEERNGNDDDDDSDSDSDSDDDEAELMRELEKIKKEREEEARRKKIEEEERLRRQEEAQIMRGNPLLMGQVDDFVIKKKWYDDGIFKNQSKQEKVKTKRFINDTVRNDFHRKFLDKYVQ